MCGIAGRASIDSIPPDEGITAAMSTALSRRGPDGSGEFRWENASLAHRRLAILDLSDRGRQPMVDSTGQIGLVFNGAIYNFRELRAELEGLGYRFSSTSDTEVLLHGYHAWGIRRLARRVSGMFAFGIWDDRSRELFLVRDRLGVKPLLFADDGRQISFASTADALQHAGLAGDLDPQSVADFLEWGVVPDQGSIFAGVQKLPPATIARWHDGHFSQEEYWQLPQIHRRSNGPDFVEAVDHTESLLKAAVSRRLQADVPIGALLSGGIDSALVCWALREAGADVETYTFSSPGAPEDETQDALRTAAELGIQLQVLEVGPGTSALSELVGAYGEPFACGSALGMLSLSAAARSSATVLLTGDGGDDVFLGYPHHRFLWYAQRLGTAIPRGAAAMLPPFRGPATGRARRIANFGAYATYGLGALLQVRRSFRFLADQGALGDRLRSLSPTSYAIPTVGGAGASVLDDYLAWARRNQFVSEYLVKVDGATMHHGLEARSPFLDHELWEFAASLPYNVRLHRGRLKSVLREIAARRISKRVAAGRKRGFEVPISRLLKGPWREEAHAALASPLLEEGGWLDTNALRKWISGSDPVPLPVWYAVVLALWLERSTSGATVSI